MQPEAKTITKSIHGVMVTLFFQVRLQVLCCEVGQQEAWQSKAIYIIHPRRNLSIDKYITRRCPVLPSAGLISPKKAGAKPMGVQRKACEAMC
jgi:hypothetical protein